MSILSAARRASRLNAQVSAQYIADQNRALAVRSSDPSIQAVLEYQSPKTVQFESGPLAVVSAAPMRAILRPDVVARDLPAPVMPGVNAELQTAVLPDPPSQSGAPVYLTLAEFRHLKPGDQARVLRQVLAFNGARGRMTPDGSSRSLADAFESELAHQRSIVLAGRSAVRDGKKVRHTKTASNEAKKSGLRPIKQGGTASFSGAPTRVSIQLEGTALTTGRHWVDPEYGYSFTEKRGRGQPTLLEKNAK